MSFRHLGIYKSWAQIKTPIECVPLTDAPANSSRRAFLATELCPDSWEREGRWGLWEDWRTSIRKSIIWEFMNMPGSCH